MALRSFQARPVTYKASAALTLIAGLLIVVGVASPYWHQSEEGSSYGGLWSRCDDDVIAGSFWSSPCVDRTVDVTEEWWLLVQVTATSGLACVVLCCAAMLFENCFSDVNAPCILQEFMGLLGGLLGLIGCIIFLVKTEPISDDDIYEEYSWSFYFVFVGTVLVFVASVVVLIGGKTAHKSLRLHRPEGQISPEPLRRFSHLWARESPATPEGARRALGSAQSRDSASSFPALPPSQNLMPVYESESCAEVLVV